MTGRILRRDVLRGGGLLLGALVIPRLRVRADEAYTLPDATRAALETSGLVYISPLRADQSESRCHGEVWFLFDQGGVLISTGTDTWKAQALAKGRDGARIWVGDFGQGSAVGDRYLEGPTFLTRAREERDPEAFRRLLDAFGKKYPDGWEKWEPRFKKGWEDGSRVLIRYQPVGG
jgi:hypothetical protein